MNVLLSIKPKYVEEIIKGNKRYEFRKSIFKSGEKLKLVYIYSTSPVKKIVGSFTIEAIIEEHPKVLWRRFSGHSGIEEKAFFEYFGTNNKGVAIKIGELDVFERPADPKKLIPNFVPPQSFRYLEGDLQPHKGLLDSAGNTLSRLLDNLLPF